MSYSKKLPIGAVGICAVRIDQDKWGETFAYWFPDGPEKFSPGMYKIHALSDIRANKSVVIVDGNCGGVEQSESNPTTTEQIIYDDYVELAFTNIETEYFIGAQARLADPSVPLFKASQIALFADKDCWIRFNSNKRVQHHIRWGVPYTFPIKCNVIYVVRDGVNGNLFLDALGSEI